MDMTPAPTPHRLPRAPLVEAIFEMQWQLKPDEPGAIDPGFKLALGRYYELLKDRFPALVNLPAAAAPDEFTPHAVRHQFRRGAEQWPLTQLGPGIMSVNDTSEYSWANFQPMIASCVRALFGAYPNELVALKPSRMVLKYLNALPFDPHKVPTLDFLRNVLHTDLQVDASHEAVGPNPGGVAIQLAYPIKGLAGVLQTTITTGKTDRGPAIIWDNSVVVEGAGCPQGPDDILKWADSANDVAAHWFTALARGALYDSFVGDNAKA